MRIPLAFPLPMSVMLALALCSEWFDGLVLKQVPVLLDILVTFAMRTMRTAMRRGWGSLGPYPSKDSPWSVQNSACCRITAVLLLLLRCTSKPRLSFLDTGYGSHGQPSGLCAFSRP